MVSKTVRFAVIGCGDIANNAYLPAITRQAELTGVCDTLEEMEDWMDTTGKDYGEENTGVTNLANSHAISKNTHFIQYNTTFGIKCCFQTSGIS